MSRNLAGSLADASVAKQASDDLAKGFQIVDLSSGRTWSGQELSADGESIRLRALDGDESLEMSTRELLGRVFTDRWRFLKKDSTPGG